MPNENKIKEVFTTNLNHFLDLRNIQQNELAKYMAVSNTTVNNWVKGYKMPRMDKIDKICTFLNINRSNLLNECSTPKSLPQLTPKDEDNIQKKLNSIIDDLSPDSGLAYFDGEEPLTDEDKELLRISLENSLRLAKQLAKQKFTPKKYRKE
jgi:transcriptional regulator with XRE-family HTH domain